MKILLINPPRSWENKIYETASINAKKFIHQKLIGPPLGLLTIAEAVKEHSVTVFDMKGEYDLDSATLPLSELTAKLVNDNQPDLVGVTFIASEFYFGIEILKTVKALNPKIITVAGGLHTTLCPDDFLNPAVDIICPGQSAFTFRELVEAIAGKKNLKKVGGILINSKKGFFIQGKGIAANYDPSGNQYLFPNRAHLSRWIETYKVGKSPDPSTYVYTSLGCPYKCTFCSIWPQFSGKFYQREIESIIKELQSIPEYPVVRFADANTVVNLDFINHLFKRIEEERIKKFFIMDIRADTAANNPLIIEKMAKNGLKVVICGFESFRKYELEKYNKSSDPLQISKAIEVFHANDIMLRGNYVIPNDYDEADFKALAEYAGKHKVVYAGYTILTPMPGTVFYQQIKDQIIDHDLAKYNFFNCILKTKLPLEKFYENVGKLWLIKEGQEVI